MRFITFGQINNPVILLLHGCKAAGRFCARGWGMVSSVLRIRNNSSGRLRSTCVPD